MVHTDTVIGIVGAVVLVAVMTGVFVYEYNNVETADDDDAINEAHASFMAAYPALDPTGDVDGDGTPNAEDDDLDGDGTPNADDEDVVYESGMSGSVGASVEPATSNSASLTVAMDPGVVYVDVAVDATPADPSGTLGDVTVEMTYNGTVVGSATGSGSLAFTVDEGIGPGEFVIRVTPSGPSLGASFDMQVSVHY